MTLHKIAYMIPLFSLVSTMGYAQTIDKREVSIHTMIEGYNQQDYSQMKKPWGFIGKILLRKKKFKKQYEPFFSKNGIATIDTILYRSKYMATVQLQFKDQPTNRATLRFMFNDRGKLQGFGFGYPSFIYRKSNQDSNSNLTLEQQALTIDSLISHRVNKKAPNNFNGCVLVSNQDQVIYKSCFGYANYQTKEMLNDTSMFLLASCTKQFTAAAIMILHEKSLLKYTDTVASYIPNFPYPNVTIEHLLTHTSGLPSYFPLLANHWDHSKQAGNKDVINLLIEHKPPLYFAPNTRFDYSNTGYILLSSIIEAVSKQTYGDFLSQHIFTPLGMNRTEVYFRRSGDTTISSYALGHVYSIKDSSFVLPDSIKRSQYVTYMDSLTGDDGVSSSVMDLYKWDKGLSSNTILLPSSLELMYAKHTLASGKKTDYGFGFFLVKGPAIEDLVYHTGGWPGYSTMIMKLEEQKKNIVILSNNDYDNFDALADEIATSLLRH
jgi:CubicO group peptidase (beta-lactamase class C family)